MLAKTWAPLRAMLWTVDQSRQMNGAWLETHPIPRPASEEKSLRSKTTGSYPFALRKTASTGPAMPAPMTPTLVGDIADREDGDSECGGLASSFN